MVVNQIKLGGLLEDFARMETLPHLGIKVLVFLIRPGDDRMEPAFGF
jgi:hypothetical protein